MMITPGSQIGAYEVIAKLGEGGMGEVYRARDTKLNRDVAIKVLPEAVALDADRLARLTREAQVLASLNHPNIAGIYGIEESGFRGPGVPESSVTRALVMELVEGDDLSALIARGALPLRDALAIAGQIIDALEAAHEQGIVHRDMKPQNIKVRDDGTVKVLDFGLAKAMDSRTSGPQDSNNSPTLTARSTQMGMILGTAAYMSPEQARGKAVDKRADIWSFGVVLFEMLTGKRVFNGNDVSDVLAAVLRQDIDWSALPDGTPLAIRRLLERCLDRDQKLRLRDMGEARIAIARAVTPGTEEPATPTTAGPARGGLLSAGLLVLGLAAGAFIAREFWPSTSAGTDTSNARPIVSQIVASPDMVAAFAHGFALSPDEQTIVYSARRADGVRMLFTRRLDTAQAVPLANTEGAVYPFWSPDSRQVGFWADFTLQSVPLEGGPARTIAPTISRNVKASWSGGDDIVFDDAIVVEGRIFHVPASGGQPREVEIGGVGRRPIWLADGRRFLFRRDTAVYAASIEGTHAPVKVLDVLEPNGHVGYGPGFLVFNQGNLLSWQAFNDATLTLEGAVMPIAVRAGAPLGWFAVSVAGRTIVALHGDPMATLQWIDRSGRDAGMLGQPDRYWTLSLSPDGQRALVNTGGVFAIDRRTGLKTRVGDTGASIWSADARHVIVTRRNVIWMEPAGGEAQPRKIVESRERRLTQLDASPDGRSILIVASGDVKAPGLDLLILSIADGAMTPFATSKYDEEQGRFSPDGEWIAYVSNATRRQEVYARRIDGATPAVLVSAGGGTHPHWRRDGKELFYLSPAGDIVAQDVGALASGGQPGPARTLFRTLANDFTSSTYSPFAVTPDGQLFLVSTPVQPDPLTLIQLPRR
jgi:Tol biopolymer transport system component